jgi:putative glutamine amidotransferase
MSSFHFHRSPRIGITDTAYAQIRFSVADVGGIPIDLTTQDSMQAMFLEGNRPELLRNRSDAIVVSEELSKGESFVRRRWDISSYKTQGGLLDHYIESRLSSFQTPSDVEFLRPIINMGYIKAQVEKLDGFVVGGGEDINPRLYFAQDLMLPNANGEMEENTYARTRDIIELAYIGEAVRQGKPILGICRGSQVVAVALGGSMVQDIPTSHPALGKRHSMATEVEKSEGHDVRVLGNSVFARILGLGEDEGDTAVRREGSDFIINVNSYHHQSVLDEFPAIQVAARDVADTNGTGKSVVEGFIARSTPALVMGVQFHPERPFAAADGSNSAFAIPLDAWSEWFRNGSRRQYSRRIFKNLIDCARKASLEACAIKSESP